MTSMSSGSRPYYINVSTRVSCSLISSRASAAYRNSFCPTSIPCVMCVLPFLHLIIFANASQSSFSTASVETSAISFLWNWRTLQKTYCFYLAQTINSLECLPSWGGFGTEQVVTRYWWEISDKFQLHFLNKITKLKPHNVWGWPQPNSEHLLRDALNFNFS